MDMTTSQTITTSTGRKVRISTELEGRNFGYVGIVKAANGRAIHYTDCVAFPEAAERLAAEYAASL